MGSTRIPFGRNRFLTVDDRTAAGSTADGKPQSSGSIIGFGETLVLTSDAFRNYGGAYYQLDFLEAIREHGNLRFYGPGFPNYDKNDSLSDVIAKSGCAGVPDTILTSHFWLADGPEGPICPMPHLSLKEFNGRKIGVINKEYSRLGEKLRWFAAQGLSLLLSHNPEIESLARGFDVNTYFFPFGVQLERIEANRQPRKFDLGFSGVLRNPWNPVGQSDFRERVMRSIFFTFRDFPTVRRGSWKELQILWRSWSGDKVSDFLARKFPQRRRLPAEEYFEAMAQTRLWLNSLSPAGIISTRYFENMASGAVVVTEESSSLRKLFGDENLVYVSSVDDFRQKVQWLAENETERARIADRAQNWIRSGHTWAHRVESLLEEIV